VRAFELALCLLVKPVSDRRGTGISNKFLLNTIIFKIKLLNQKSFLVLQFEIIEMETRERILEHASKKFMSIGIRNVTMDTLANELSISKRTIYELFGDKDNLVIESLRFMILENNKQLLSIIENAENVVEAIFLIMKRQKEMREDFPVVFVEDIKRYFPLVQASFYSCKSDLKQFSASFTLLEKGISQGIFRNDLQIELVDNFIHELVSLLHTSERIRVLNPSDKDIFYNLLLPYFRGICTEKGLKLIDNELLEKFENINR